MIPLEKVENESYLHTWNSRIYSVFTYRRKKLPEIATINSQFEFSEQINWIDVPIKIRPEHDFVWPYFDCLSKFIEINIQNSS